MRIAIAIIFLWIGGLKFAPYEADSITPFVANNPVMSLFYKHPDQYAQHLTREGELKPAQRAWQTANDTYGFSRGLGTVELMIGFLTLAGLMSRRWGLVGAVLAFLTPFVTLVMFDVNDDAKAEYSAPPSEKTLCIIICRHVTCGEDANGVEVRIDAST
jgi:uncharacterized membrane protein YkgB